MTRWAETCLVSPTDPQGSRHSLKLTAVQGQYIAGITRHPSCRAIIMRDQDGATGDYFDSRIAMASSTTGASFLKSSISVTKSE